MLKNNLVNKSAGIFAENRLLKFVVLCLALLLAWNSLLVMRALRYEKIILIPPHMTGNIEFVHGKPSDIYIKDIARKVVLLSANYSPATARIQFEELLVYYAPESYPEMQKEYYSLASRIESSQVSSAFYPEEFDLKDDQVSVRGAMRQFTGSTFVQDKTVTFIVKYKIVDGRLEIITLKEK